MLVRGDDACHAVGGSLQSGAALSIDVPPRRRASPAPFFLADCGGLSVGWVSCSDVISGVESALWEGCYPH